MFYNYSKYVCGGIIMNFKIDFQFEIPLIKTLSNVFTFGEFRESYMKILEVFYKKDNNGREREKPKLSFWDGKSFDKVYNNIYNKSKESANTLLTKDFIDYALRELNSYKGKKSPNKLNLVQEVIKTLQKVYGYFNGFLSDSEEKIRKFSTRDLICYMNVLQPHLKCKKVKEIYNIYCDVYNTRPSDEKKNNFGTTALVYNVEVVKNYVEKLKTKLMAESKKSSSAHDE